MTQFEILHWATDGLSSKIGEIEKERDKVLSVKGDTSRLDKRIGQLQEQLRECLRLYMDEAKATGEIIVLSCT